MPVLTAAAIVLLVTGAAIYAVIVYNGLVRLQNEIGRAWANIDVLLKQRHDEVPNLVACVKGYMDHERQTLEAVTQARAASINASSIPQKGSGRRCC
jgi:LemA protein